MPKRTRLPEPDEIDDDIPIEEFRLYVSALLCRIIAERDHRWRRCRVSLCRRSHMCNPVGGQCAARRRDRPMTEEECDNARNAVNRVFNSPEVIAFCRQGEMEERAREAELKAKATRRGRIRIDKSDQQS